MAEPGLPTRELILWDGTVPCLLRVQPYQCPSIPLPEPAAHSATLTDLKEATHMLKISPGAGPDFSAHYGTELLTDDLNSRL